jgi:amino acid transporter
VKQTQSGGVPESMGYAVKRLLLGRPLITERLRVERLSNPVALGVLSSDAMSSAAYGTEEMLLELLPFAGLAAFTLVLPITGVILVILALVAASYRQVLMVYTRAGGSYVVAKDNFGPRVAQIAAAALLIDYVVTVAVQSAAGTVAVVSALPALGPYSLEITVGVVLALCYLNLRGLREAGRSFAVPAYLFVTMVGLTIVVGVVRALTTGLPRYDPTQLPGTVPVHDAGGLVMGASVLVVLRSFANGGSSLTGVEAISNTVSAFRKPQGGNARAVLTVMAAILGFMVAGVSVLAYLTHATPYLSGYPSVLSQEARAVFGSGMVGQVMFALVQAATALILYTGANTSFNGFPFLASFIAADRFLPRQLTKRGHRLVFSNGIMVLTVLSVALLLFTGGTVNALVPFYAIGVFTGFAMAGYGMTKYHLTHQERGWRYRLVINCAAAVLSTVVVGVFAVAKFTEGAWLVVVLFPMLVFVLIRLNREYRAEAAVLERGLNHLEVPRHAEHRAFVFVDALDLAVIEALRYGRTLRPDRLTAVHFIVDTAAAERLRHRWEKADVKTPLRMIDVPDRRITRAAAALVAEALRGDDVEVTVLLPRRGYAPLLGRLLHDRSADRIAEVISRFPHAAATIVPFDVQSKIRQMFPNLPEERITAAVERWLARITDPPRAVREAEHPEPARDATPIGEVTVGATVTVVGRLHEITLADQDTGHLITARLMDDTGSLTVEFDLPNPDLKAGQLLRLTGTVQPGGPDDSDHSGQAGVMRNPSYHILEEPVEEDPAADTGEDDKAGAEGS